MARFLFFVVGSVLLQACSSPEPIVQTTRETIRFESVDLPGRLWDPFMPPLSSGKPVDVEARLTLPPTDVPLPLIIIAHGCGGVGGGEVGWASFLERSGVASLIVDSFDGRGIESICSGAETINVGSVLVDVFRAFDAVKSHPWVDTDRVAILGLSFGGRTALWSAMTRFQDQYHGRPFRGHIAFYPSTCYIRLEGEAEVSDGPIRVFHGTNDDWTPIEQCRDYVDRLEGAGVDARMYEYDGAEHAFDNSSIQSARLAVPALSPRNCEFVEHDGAIIDARDGRVASPTSRCVRLGVHVGYSERARADAREHLMRFLEEIFDL